MKPSQTQLDPTAPKYEGGSRRKSGMSSAQVIGRTAKGQAITVTDDGDITYVETGRYARETGLSAAEATSTQRSAFSSPIRGRLNLGDHQNVVSSSGGPEKESVDKVRQERW